MEIHASARAYSIADAGPDRAGNIVELVILDRREGPLVIHATAIRRSTAQALFGDEHS